MCDENPAERWHRIVAGRGCQVCPRLGRACDGPVQAHHVTTQQYIKRYVRGLGLPQAQHLDMLARLLWDTRNGLGVCYRAHRRHTNATERIPLALVPEQARAFAEEIGLAYVLPKQYAGSPVHMQP